MKKSSSFAAEEQVRYFSKSALVINLGYVGSVFGILKAIEFLLLLVSWGLIVNFQGFYSFPITIYYIAITVSAWVYVIIEFKFYLFKVQKKFGSVWPYFSLFMTLSLAAALITANGLLTYLTRVLFDQNLSPNFCRCVIVITTCNVLIAACIFGYLAILVLLLDAYLHYREYEGSYQVHYHCQKY